MSAAAPRPVARAALGAVLALACTSHSPFRTTPSELALHAPCRYMGSVHKESRARIETLRMCGAVSADEWLCMARALESLDDHFTELCRSRNVRFREIADEQRRLYASCRRQSDPEVVACGILSTDEVCLEECCAGVGPRGSVAP